MIWSRWSGAGNTFYIADEWNQKWNLPRKQRTQVVSRICKAFPNAPTDGLLFLEKKEGFDFTWDFYNSDGSHAEMCGNAARCASLYFMRNVEKKKKLRFLTVAGEIETTNLSKDQVDHVRVLMPKLPAAHRIMNGEFHINTGVPHFVLECEPNMARAQELRPLPIPKGSNVTFLTSGNESGGTAVSFERGVEGFTAACGTGAVAAAAYLVAKFNSTRAKIQMPGGVLIVENAAPGQRPILEGPAKKDYEFDDSEKPGDF